MTLDRFSLAVICCLLSAVSFSEDARSLWNPGLRYETYIRYSFKMKNCWITPDPDGSYRRKGSFRTPELEFKPVFKFTTQEVSRDGHNYHARRVYENSTICLHGASNLEWKSDYRWYNPKRWAQSVSMLFDHDLKDFKKLQDGDKTEEFLLFSFGGEDGVVFSPENEALLLSWTDQTLSDYFSHKSGVNSLKVHLGDKNNQMSDIRKQGLLGLPYAPDIVRDTIRAECNVTASAIFDSPGKGLAIDSKRRRWSIDASAINGLLANDKLRKYVNFSGTLKVKRRRVSLEEMREKNMPPFTATCVEAVDSEGVRVGFDTGSGVYDTFPLTVSAGSPENKVEFWFDEDNEVLRYAKVKIVNHDYNGNLPNPGLGKMISRVKGRATGDVEFVCEYFTDVTKEGFKK